MHRSPVNTRKTPADVGFVACIEDGILEAQALLLFESIRRFGGRFKDCAIYALSPRRGRAISRAARRRLEDLDVIYIDAVLNTECREYGSANRVAAAAHVEATSGHDVLVILDSDTLFLREPDAIWLSPDTDAVVRPVDVKGVSTGGSTDAFDAYWQALCRCCGVAYDSIPHTRTFVDGHRVKANYNGGLVVVRRELGILSRWASFFFASVRQGLRPQLNAPTFRSGAGWVDPTMMQFWGSNQAALSLALWHTTRQVRELPPTYNYPLHLHDEVADSVARAAFPHLVHVHYHWLLEADALAANPLFRAEGPLSMAQRDWLAHATPIG